MPDSWNRPVRKSPRLQGYDYRQEGAYFVTICTHQRGWLFGEVVEGVMNLNSSGHIAEQCWQAIPDHFPQVEIDAFVVMPNHVHGIIVIAGQPTRRDGRTRREERTRHDGRTRHASSLQSTERPRGAQAGSLGAIAASYKSAVTRQIRELLGSDDLPVWQERYHDHIIRNEQSLNQIRQYVIHNPELWQQDTFFTSTHP